MMTLRSVVLFAAPLLALLLALAPLAQSQTTTWYLCAVLQGSAFQSIDQATLTVNSTTTARADYNGIVNTAYSVEAIQSGSRSYTDLTVASPAAVTVAMASLAPPGSTGGNTNFFWPGTLPQMLDGDGLTFNFASNVTINGQGQGPQMNLWWSSGINQLDEEVSGGNHESAAMQSTLIISTTQPTCAVPSYAQFSMCLIITGSGYTTIISALINTTGTAARVAASSANGLPSALQGWTITSILNGQRVYTPTSGSATTSTVSAIAAANSIASNDNLAFPDSTGYGVFDAAGVGFTLAAAAPFADGSSASSLAIKYSNGKYYEQTASTTESTSSSYIAFNPYFQGTSLPPCAAIATTYTFRWSVQGSGYFSSVITGTLTISPLAAGTASTPYWLILCVTGSRVYTDLTTNITTTNTITALLSSGHIGGNDNKMFLNSPQLLDGDGFSLQFDGIPPIYGQNVTGQTNTMNLWWNNPTYLEENKGGTHEVNATSSSFTVTATSASASCLTSSNAAAASTAASVVGLVAALVALAIAHSVFA